MATFLTCMFSSKRGSVALSLTLILRLQMKLCVMLIGFGPGTSHFNTVFNSRFNYRTSSYLYTIPLFLSVRYSVQDHVKNVFVLGFFFLSLCYGFETDNKNAGAIFVRSSGQ